MSTVQIADIYEPLTFRAEVDEKAIEKNALLTSGVISSSPKLSELATVGGRIGELPFHKPLDVDSEPDYVNDDPDDKSVPDKIGTAKQIWRLASMHKSWSTMDFARELALMDPLGAITSKIGGYWATQQQRRVIQSAMGIMADNVANDNEDMVVDIYGDLASPAATNIIDADSFLDTRQTAGDHQGMFSSIAMHSVTFTTLNKQNLIDFIPNAQGVIDFPSYLGATVIIDDTMPVITGTNAPKYVTLLLAPGAFDHGNGEITNASAMERIESAGNGAGQDIIHSRKSEIYHPPGYQFTSTTVAAESATLAELALAANWDRVIDRKHIGMAFLLHNN